MKKIIFFQPPIIAGAMICLKEQIIEFKKLKYDIILVITGNYREDIEDFFKETDVILYFIRIFPWIDVQEKRDIKKKVKIIIKHCYNMTFGSYEIRAIISKFNPDIIYCNSFDNYVPLIIASRKKILSVLHLHEYGILDHNTWFISEKYAKKVLKKVSLNICISDAVKNFYESKFQNVNFRRVYDGISNDIIDCNAEFPNEVKDIGIVGRITENKGQHMVIQCAKFFPQMKFHIWGQIRNAEYLKKCKEIIRLEKINNVVFEGYNSDIKKIYKNIEAIVVPSKCEAFGRIVIEAMANKKLVIASNTGSFSELIINEVDGLLFDYNVDDMVKVLKKLNTIDVESITRTAYKKVNASLQKKMQEK